MKAVQHKNEILESLKALDQSQSEKVLEYIKDLLHTSRHEATHRKIKRDALKEIRQALESGTRFTTSF